LTIFHVIHKSMISWRLLSDSPLPCLQ